LQTVEVIRHRAFVISRHAVRIISLSASGPPDLCFTHELPHSLLSHVRYAMSALPPKAGIVQHGGNVRFVPKADIVRCGENTSLFDRLVGDGEHARRNCKTERFCGFEVDDPGRSAGFAPLRI